jgi:hypothetical protein
MHSDTQSYLHALAAPPHTGVPCSSYSQFLFALLKLSEKRKSGFQEVVGKILMNINAVPTPSHSDFLVFTNTGE